MDENTLITFGKHNGTKLGEVPASYLLWFYEKGWFGVNEKLKEWIKDNLEEIKLRAEKEK